MEHSLPYEAGRRFGTRNDANDLEVLAKVEATVENKNNRLESVRIEALKGEEKAEALAALTAKKEAAKTKTKGKGPYDKLDDTVLIHLPLNPIYDDHGSWRKETASAVKNFADGGRQYTWSGIGYPNDETLCVEDFESETFIDKTKTTVQQLVADLSKIKNSPAAKIADSGIEHSQVDHGRIIERFTLNGRSVTKVKFVEADVNTGGYEKLKTSTEFEKKLRNLMGKQAEKPSHEVVQYLMAHLMLCAPKGKLGPRMQEYWSKTRDLAQQQIYTNPELEKIVTEHLKKNEFDPVLKRVLEIVKAANPKDMPNPYHQAQRIAFAVHNKLFYTINSEIVMILDKADHIIDFSCWDTFLQLLQKSTEDKVLNGFQTWSTLQPVPHPDSTRHSLHWVEHLINHPEFDFRNPNNDKRTAWSGAEHHGCGCGAGKTDGKAPIYAKTGSGERLKGASDHVLAQVANLRKSCFGACTELVSFFFEVLEPELFQKYQAVAQDLDRRGDPKVIFKTRPDTDPFSMRALLVNFDTTEHKDLSDWMKGFAGMVPVGNFVGGNLLLRDLGLQIVTPPGTAMLIRGRELTHAISKYTGNRFCVVHVVQDAIRRWHELGEDGTAESSTVQ